MADRSLKVLVADDSSVMRRLILSALSPQGAACHEAENGAEALRLLRSDPDGFDLLVVDINLPILDGLKVIGALRRDPRYEHLPVLVVTTERAAGDRTRALSLGASEYLTKPVRADEVQAAVRRLLGHS